MNGFIKTIAADRIIFRSILAAMILLFLTLAFIFVSYFRLPPFLPIYNQLPWGDARFGKQYEIFLPVIIAVCIILFNMVIVHIFYGKMPLVSRMIAITSFLVSFVLLIFVFRTILLVL